MDAAEYSKHWFGRKVWRNLRMPKHQRRFDAIAELMGGDSCLDVGCAAGHSTSELKVRYPTYWMGLDFCTEMVSAAVVNFPSIHFELAESLSAFVAANKIPFTAIACSEVIEHVEDDTGFVADLLSLNADVLVMTTPCRKVNDPGHLRLYDQGAIELLFSGHEGDLSLSHDECFWYISFRGKKE